MSLFGLDPKIISSGKFKKYLTRILDWFSTDNAVKGCASDWSERERVNVKAAATRHRS